MLERKNSCKSTFLRASAGIELVDRLGRLALLLSALASLLSLSLASHCSHQCFGRIEIEEPVKQADENERHAEQEANDAEQHIGSEGEQQSLEPGQKSRAKKHDKEHREHQSAGKDYFHDFSYLGL